MKIQVPFLLLAMTTLPVIGASITSLSSGNWNNATTWDCGCIPLPSDDITIAAGHTVALTANTEIRSINVSAASSAVNIGNYTFDIKNTSINRGSISGTGTLSFGSGSTRTFTNTGTISVSGVNVVSTSMFNNSGTVSVTGNINITLGYWTNAIFSSLNVGGTISGSASNFTSAEGNSVSYTNTGNQTVLNATYHNLTLSGAGTKTLGGNITVNGDLNIMGVSRLDVSAFNYAINLAGNWNNQSSDADAFVERSGTVVMNNSSGDDQYITKDAAETFYSLGINNSGADVVLDNSVTVNNTLTLTSGDVVLNNHNLILGSSSGISGGGSGSYIHADGTGSLRKMYAAGLGDNISRTFPIGDADEYNPVTFKVNPVSVAGSGAYINFNVTDASHASLSSFPGASHLSKYWTLSGANFTLLNYDISFIYSETDVVGNEAAIRPAIWTGLDPLWLQIGTLNTLTNTGAGSGLLLFGAFGGVSAAPLPITLVHFNASLQEEKVILDWLTSSEVNNSHFTVERSVDGVTFEELETVEGMGTTCIPHNYDVVDEKPLDGIAYYRLKQTDFDGKYRYSALTAVDNSPKEKMLVYPNPAVDGKVYISGLNGEATVVLYDLSGRPVFVSHGSMMNNGELILPASVQEAPGMYSLVVVTGKESYKQKLVVR